MKTTPIKPEDLEDALRAIEQMAWVRSTTPGEAIDSICSELRKKFITESKEEKTERLLGEASGYLIYWLHGKDGPVADKVRRWLKEAEEVLK
jgi:hypothetical protein